MIDRTDELLATLEPVIAERAYYLVLTARQADIPLLIISARRSPATNLDVGGSDRSLHLRGLAFDVAVYGYHRDTLPPEWWEQLGLWAEGNLGLYWGGRFLHAGRPDVNHFDARRLLTEV